MKTVHITNYYHKDSGGISTTYNKLLEAANRHRRYVRLIVPGETSRIEEVGKFGRIYFIEANFSPLFDKRYRLMLPWKTYIFDQSPIKRILREEQPDVIEIGEKYTLSLMAGLLRKGIMNVSPERPMLVHLSCERMDDNVGSFISRGKLAKWFCERYMGSYVFPMFDFHLTNSDYTAQELFEAVSSEMHSRRSNVLMNFAWRFFRSGKAPISERVFVNQCGVDTETFSIARHNAETRRQICEEYDLPHNATLLLYAGRVSPEKNVALLPKVMKILAADKQIDFRLLVAGDGPSSASVAAEFGSHAKEKVRMLGHLNDREALANLFANCDAFVHPNPREPFGITPLEAMASGLPVVAPNSGGLLSYANDGNAWLVEPMAEQFAAAIRAVFGDVEHRRAKVAKALETSKSYTWESATDALFALYDKMYNEFSEKHSIYAYGDAPRGFDFAKECSVNS